MLLTEEEAAVLLCPQMLAFIRPGEPPTPDVCCRGRACMAWRTVAEDDHLRKRGYCGLAGRPE